jgi:hypothetical protein
MLVSLLESVVSMAGDNSEVKAPLPRSSEGARRLYEPPAIEETSEFETLSLTCLHTPGGPGDCDEVTGEPQS